MLLAAGDTFAITRPAAQLLRYLVTAAADEGNYLLNIGPRADGTVRRAEVTRLRQIGRWLKVNGQAIYGSQRCGRIMPPGSQIWTHENMLGFWTCKGNVGYLHVFHWPGSEAVASLVGTRAVSATVLQTAQRAKIRQEHNGRLVICGLLRKPPDPHVTVIKVRFVERPGMLRQPDRAAWLTGKA
ncbi:MAG: alpha-L-fucosidase [Phycisphaerae bacterium]|nr:alpha-L-fucosidase [Phycisphaerae bacterium]